MILAASSVAAAEPRTITITTTTTVALEPDATISDRPPGETPPDDAVATAAPIRRLRVTFAAGPLDWRDGIRKVDTPMTAAELRLGLAVTRHLATPASG